MTQKQIDLPVNVNDSALQVIGEVQAIAQYYKNLALAYRHLEEENQQLRSQLKERKDLKE